jgi:hypothetical protein
MEAGLVDAVESPSATIGAVLTGLLEDSDEEDTYMSKPNPAAAAAPEGTSAAPAPAAAAPAPAPAVAGPPADQASAIVAERERIGAILGCEEAKGREGLAQHFAMKTGMSAEDAKVALAAAPKAAEPAAPEPEGNAAPKLKRDPFGAAMDASEHPNVGAGSDTQGSGPDGRASRVAGALGGLPPKATAPVRH